jgi:hypothetical protein
MLLKKLFFAALAFTTLSMQAQTADEIIAKHTDALGGIEKLKLLTTAKKSGTVATPNGDFPLTESIVHGKGYRVDLEIMGTSNYQFITPTKAFTFFPIQQMTEPKEFDAERLASSQGQFDLHGSFIDYKTKGNKVEFVANEKYNGEDVYKLKLTRTGGKEIFYFISKKTNFIVKSTSKDKGPDGSEMEMVNEYSNYKQNKDGYWFAYSKNTPNGMITYDTIDTNVKIDENIFNN